MSTKHLSRRHFGASALALTSLALGLPRAGHAAAGYVSVLDRPALRVVRPTQCVLLAVARAGQRVVVAGERGLILVSDDFGQTWNQSAVPVSVSLTALAFENERDGWAVGNLGVVLRTRDAGATWQRVLDGRAAAAIALKAAKDAPPPAAQSGTDSPSSSISDAQRFVDEGADKPFLNVARQPDGSVVVVGAYGLAFSSPDEGKSWTPLMQRLPNPEGFSYYGMVSRKGEQFLYGEQGLLLHAAARTEPFLPQKSPSIGSFFAALTLREGPLLLMGLRGKIYRSGEVGASWETVQTPVDASLFAGLQLTDGTVLVVGAAGQVLASRNGGQDFTPLTIRNRFPFNGLATAPDGALVLVGQRGVMRLPPDQLKAALDFHEDASASRAG